jgi:type IV pilus assembly protein PilE
MSKSINRGFTLIELMLVIVVLSVIAAIALPSFLGQIQKARRSDGKQALYDVAAKLEQYYQDNKGYPTTADMTNLGYAGATFTSLEGYYTIGFNGVPTATTYIIEAVPIAPQDDDTDCATFRMNHLGVKSVTGSLSADRCW